MFPRAFFAGRYFAPRYFPQSSGTPDVDAPVCGVLAVTPLVNGTLGIEEC